VTEAARLYTTIGADLSGLRVGARQAEGISRGISGSLAKAAAKGAAAFGALRIGTAIGREVTKLDRGLRATNSLFGVTGKAGERSFNQLRMGVRKLSDDVGVAQTTITEGLYQAISAGVPRENAFGFLKIASKAAIAGVTDTETSVDALTTALNSFKSQGLQAQRAADVMFQTVNRGKVEFPELAQYIGEASSFVAAANVRFDDFGAAVATMTAKGVKVGPTMTSIKQAMQSVLKPTEAMQAAYQKLGVKGWDQLLKRSGSLQGALGALEKAAGGNKAKLFEMFGSVDAVQAVLKLTGDNARDAAKDLDAIRNSTGAANKAFNEMDKGVGRAFERLKTNVMNAGITFSNQFLPDIIAGANQLTTKLNAAMQTQGFEDGMRRLGAVITTTGSMMAAAAGFAARHKDALMTLAVGYTAAKIAAQGYALAQMGMQLASSVGMYVSLAGSVRSVSDAFVLLRMAVASNPIGAVMTAAALAGTAIAAFAMRNRESATASNQAAAAARGLQTAMTGFANAEVAARQAQLSQKSAAQELTRAQVAAGTALNKHGRDSSQYKTAMDRVAQAQVSLAQAQLDTQAATERAGDAAAKLGRKWDRSAKQAREAAGNIAEAQKQLVMWNKEAAAGNKQAPTEILRLNNIIEDQSKAWQSARDSMASTASELKRLDAATGGTSSRIQQLANRITSMPSQKTVRVDVNTYFNTFGKPPKGRANGGIVLPYASGGQVRGPGTGRSDSIPAMLSNGEFVVNARDTKRNMGLLRAINSGRVAAFANGGLASKKSAPSAGGLLANATFEQSDDLGDLKRKRGIRWRKLENTRDDESKAERKVKKIKQQLRGAKGDKRDKLQMRLSNAQMAYDQIRTMRRQLADEIASLDRQIAQLTQEQNEETQNKPAKDAGEAFDKLKAGFSEQKASAEMALAQAMLTEGTDDDALAKAKLAEIAKAEASAYTSFLNSTPGLSQDQRTQIMQDIAAALQASGASGGNGVAGLDGGGGGGGELGALFSRSSGSGGSAGSSVGLSTTGGDAGGVGYVPDPDEHPVFLDGEQINDLDFLSGGMLGVLITSILGWDEAEIARFAQEDRSGQDGELLRELLMGGAPLEIKGIVSGSSKRDLETRWRELRAKLQPAHGRTELVLKLPDPVYSEAISTVFAESMTGYLRRTVRVVGTAKRGNPMGRYAFEFSVQLRSSDPRRYSDVSQTVETTSISTGGGRTYPKTFARSYGEASDGGTVECVNAGDYETPATLVVHGPVTNPIIEDTSGDGYLEFSDNGGLIIPSGEFLEIDLRNHTARLNGDAEQNRFKYLDHSTSKWWMLPEGSSTMRLRGSVISDPAQLEVTFRDAYL
jgi:TP901 family phage tail tape measure protein